jgi:hypothetical protein
MSYMIRYAYNFSLFDRKPGAMRIGPHRPEDFVNYGWGYALLQEEAKGVLVPRSFKTEDDAWDAILVENILGVAGRALHDHHFLVEKYSDENWTAREFYRLQKTYEPVPWADEPWAYTDATATHYPHYAMGDPTKLAYTENEAKGKLDVQLVTKPGRYLRKFYGDVLTNDEIEMWTQKWAAREEVSVLFADTPDDIEHVYTNGPSSCMSYDADDFASCVHPSRVYGAGDLAVAYIKRGGKITARALVWPEKKIYGRIYGDEGRIKPKLADLGFYYGSLAGAKLLRIENDCGSIVMPYIDGCGSYDDHGTYCTIDGPYSAENTTGLGDRAAVCDNCGDTYNSDYDGVYIESTDQWWCEHCVDQEAFYCSEICEMVRNEDGVTLANGSMLSQRGFERRNGWTCAISNENYISDEYVIVDDEPVHTDYIGYAVEVCAYDDEYYYTSDMTEVTLDDGSMIRLHNYHVDLYKADNPEQFETADEDEVEAA